jgi:UDP-N-acetylglucosamine--N-acetylmuramyl-(pentapeptide) pyrophosphoryl-undecaprenol N-acetylglucosamine transferase
MLKIKPQVVFSKGGFVSAPVVWAAWCCGVPVVIHESDATPALATKLTLPFCHTALFSFKETLEKISPSHKNKSIEIGLPVRESLFHISKEEGLNYFQLSDEKKVVLVFGGSLGAQSLNEKIFEMAEKLTQKYHVIHITGKGNTKELELHGRSYQQFKFLNEGMKYAYAAADLALCRAGASSIFELAAARIPMILFPLGLHASRGDQIINARIFANKGWAQWIDESKFDQQDTLALIDSTLNSIQTHKNALALAPTPDAAKKVGEILWNIIQKTKKKS